MKNLLIAFLLLTTLVFGAVAFKQNQKKSEADAAIVTLQENLTNLQSRLEQQEKQASSLQTHLLETRTESVVKSAQLTHLEQALTNQAQTASNAANPIADMFKSKDMRDLIRTQQKAVLGPMMGKNYAGFFSALNLSPEQSATLKDLIVKKSLVDAQMGVNLMSGDLDADKRKELVQQARTEKDGINDEIKQFLGDENYTQFQAYEKTQPERTAVNTFKDQLASGPNALNPEQENQLVQAMSEERQNFKFSTDFYDQSKFNGDLASVFTEDNINKFEQERNQLDQRYLARAQSILTPDQIGPFEKSLTTQSELQKTGMRVAVKMFGGKTASN